MIEAIREFFAVESPREFQFRQIMNLIVKCYFLGLLNAMSYEFYLLYSIQPMLFMIFLNFGYLMWIFSSSEEIVWEVFGVQLDEFLTITFFQDLIDDYRGVGVSEWIEYRR